jgi:uncharacterized protein YndB with AHSA1/START domain
MATIHTEVTIDRAPDDVWAVLGDFGNVDWVPGLASARMEGKRRVCTMDEGGEIHEDLERDDDRRSFSYVQVVHPLGLKRSDGTVSVEPHDGGSRVVWDSEIEFADEAQESQFLPMLEQGYAGAMQALKQQLEG